MLPKYKFILISALASFKDGYALQSTYNALQNVHCLL